MKAAPFRELSKLEIVSELRRKGWKEVDGFWKSPYHKRVLQSITLSEAAGVEGLVAFETLD